MKKLNNLQRAYLDNILSISNDYNSFDEIGVEGILALRVMCGEKDDENLNVLVNKFIAKYRKENKGE